MGVLRKTKDAHGPVRGPHGPRAGFVPFTLELNGTCPPYCRSKAPTVVSLLRSSKPTLQPTRTPKSWEAFPRPGGDITKRAQCRDLFMGDAGKSFGVGKVLEFLGNGEHFAPGPCPLPCSRVPCLQLCLPSVYPAQLRDLVWVWFVFGK